MAEFDFSMDPESLNKKIDKEQANLDKGIASLKKYEKGLSEQERIILEIAKKRQRMQRAANVSRAEQIAANAPRPSPFQAAWNAQTSPMGFEFGHGTGTPPIFPSSQEPILPRDRSGGGRGRSPFEKDAGYGGGGIGAAADKFVTGMASLMPAVAMFAAAVHTFGNMTIQANQTRAENITQVGDMKVRAQRAGKSLGLSEGEILNTVTTSTNPEAAMRAHEAWAAKKRRTGIGPPPEAMGHLVSAAQSGAIDWNEAAQSGLEGTWGRYAQMPGLEGGAKDYNQLKRGQSKGDWAAAGNTYENDLEAAKLAMYDEVQWKNFQATHPWASKIPFARASREIPGLGRGDTPEEHRRSNADLDREAAKNALENLPTSAGYSGAPSPSVQAPIQELGVDMRSSGKGVPTFRVQNPEAFRPRPQLDVRNGNNTTTGN